jgi:hypothetical protein
MMDDHTMPPPEKPKRYVTRPTGEGIIVMFKLRPVSLFGFLTSTTFLTGMVFNLTVAAAQTELPGCPSDTKVLWTNCQGTYIWPGGQKYVGQFKDGKANGQGTYTSPDGRKYVGNFKDFRMDGQGTYTWANGDNHVGQFKDNKLNGPGTTYSSYGSILQSGIWVEDNFLGPENEHLTVTMENVGGVYKVPIRINDTISLTAILDSGSADVSIPADVVATLFHSNTLSSADFIGARTYVLADGSKLPSQRFVIKSLSIGSKTLENVTANIIPAKAAILLGQSFLSHFSSWSIDNDKHALILN